MVQGGAGDGRRKEDAPPLRLVGDDERPPANLPAVPEPREPATLIGTVVHRGKTVRPRVAVGRAVHVITDVATHQRTRTAGRQVVYFAAGAAITAQRMWQGRAIADYQRGLAAALAAGDQEKALEWGRLLEEARRNKRKHGLDRAELIARILGKAHWIVGGICAFLLLIGVALMRTSDDPQQLWAAFRAIADLVRFVTIAVTLTWLPAVLVTPFIVVAALWHVGRTHVSSAPEWQVGNGEPADGRDVIPDEGAILNALRNLAITPLNQAFKNGWRPRFVLGTGRDGKGWRTQLELPAGVTVDMVNQKKPVLAHNLVRLPVEVWATEPKTQPGVLDLWCADPGSLTGPVAPWPLLEEGTTDYFKGVPVGVDIRGSVVLGRLFEANYGIAGMMGSGKSTMIITLLLGAMLDALVDIDVFVMAINADYDPMELRLRTLLAGPGDEIVEACLDRLRRAYDDLNVRGRALQEHGERAVTRKLAEKDPRLRPEILVVDECQALYMHPEMGEEAADLTVKLISAARKYAKTLIFATPEPSTASLPRKVMAVTSNKACFAIGDQLSNDAILGTGSYKAGISAVSLEPKTADGPGDIGTAMARGFQSKPGLLRSFYVAQGQVAPVVERAMKLREKAGLSGAAAVEVERRDLLDDLNEVIGEEKQRLTDLVSLLRDLAPRWTPYEHMTGRALGRALDDAEVRTTNTDNVPRLDPADLRKAIARRDAEDHAEANE